MNAEIDIPDAFVELHKSWSFFNDNKPYELDCSKMGWAKQEEHGSAD